MPMTDRNAEIVRPYVNIVLTASICPDCRNYATISDEEELAAKVSALVRNQIIGYSVHNTTA